MPSKHSLLKPVLLSFAIIVGLFAQNAPAHARDVKEMIVAGGCFWCVEADFDRVQGVIDVVSGFTGGNVRNPSYAEVVAGDTGHYEAVIISYDPHQVSYDQLLNLFLRSIDPTDAGGQFCDRGNSYRTAIFVSNRAESASAQAAISQAQADLGQNIVTPILNAKRFYLADEFHQNYYLGSTIVVTRQGPKTQAEAYNFYRQACGRDARITQLWGSAAPFTK